MFWTDMRHCTAPLCGTDLVCGTGEKETEKSSCPLPNMLARPQKHKNPVGSSTGMFWTDMRHCTAPLCGTDLVCGTGERETEKSSCPLPNMLARPQKQKNPVGSSTGMFWTDMRHCTAPLCGTDLVCGTGEREPENSSRPLPNMLARPQKHKNPVGSSTGMFWTDMRHCTAPLCGTDLVCGTGERETEKSSCP